MTTAAERAYHTLKSNIISGRYLPGQHLRESEIAAEMQLSRTPIREALRRLTAEQWFVQVPNYGVKVTEWSRDDIEVFFSLRILIEGYIAERAAEKITDTELDELIAIQKRYEAIAENESSNKVELQAENLKFHQTILAAAKSSWLEKIASSLVTFPVLLATYRSYDDNQLQRSISQHNDLIEAFQNHSIEWAGLIMRAHIYGAKESFLAKQEMS